MTPSTSPQPSAQKSTLRGASRKPFWLAACVLLIATAVFAWFRVGILDLPHIPSSLTLEAAGIVGLSDMKTLNSFLWSEEPKTEKVPGLAPGIALAREGIAAHRRGNEIEALDKMRQGLRLEPTNLVLANNYRILTFTLRRDFLASARKQGLAAPKFPPELERQPIVFFEELDGLHPSRETKLNLSLAWVDEMLLFPALEIKAPSSVQSVDYLTEILEHGNPNYVPALYARGLNHLHRPSRLVWPESAKTPRDAAVQDLARCVAIGRHFNTGSSRLQATLAICLGDAYIKTGRLDVARSWWQIAQNLCREPDVQESIRRRYSWKNEEMLDRLEEELDRGRSELEHPMTDMAFVWD